jgi:hypothetical protein
MFEALKENKQHGDSKTVSDLRTMEISKILDAQTNRAMKNSIAKLNQTSRPRQGQVGVK